MYDERGSVWRKWDLHVHTPSSIIQHFGGDQEEVWEKYISDLEDLPKEYSVLGINDYLFIDGYERLIKEKEENGRLENIDLLLPVVEFRIEKFAGVDFGRYSRINLHVIFSNEIDPKVIRRQFLNTLDQSYVLSRDDVQWKRTIDRESLIHLGEQIRATMPEDKREGSPSNLELGFNNLNLKEDQIFESLDKDCFERKYLTAVGKTEWAELKWSKSSIGTKKDIINKVDFVFTASETIEQYQKSKQTLIEQGVNDLLIDCSDAHHFSTSKEKERIGSSLTWIKSDPSFEGLRHLKIEPEARMFIGEIPPKLKWVNENETEFISKVEFQKKENSNDDDIWFDNVPRINLNHDLIAVIGNKGTGKSAFTDIVSLIGKTMNYKNFSFLSYDKFRNPQNDKSQYYEASLEWEDGSIDGPVDLSENPDSHEYEKVKYLPQNFIEDLCNPITKEETEKFEKELKEVIFSWVPDDERLNQTSLDGIIEYKSEVTEEKIRDLREKINEVNKKTLELENKLTEEYRKKIEERLEKKKNELKSHIGNKPTEVKKPEKELEKDSELKEINDKFRNLKHKISDLNSRKTKYESIVKKINDRIAASDRLKDRIALIDKYIQDIKIKSSEDLVLLNLDFDQLISVKSNLKPVTDKKTNLLELKDKIQNHLNNESEENKKSLSTRIKELSEQKDELENKLDERNQAYQEYLTGLEEWEEKKEELIGAEDKLNSKKYYEKELERIDDYPEAKKELERKREGLVRKIHKNYIDLKSLYSDLYKPVYEFIESHKELLEDFQLSFDVSIESKDFKKNFLDKIHQGRVGTFQGEENGYKNLSTVHDSVDFNKEGELVDFLASIDYALHNVKGTDKKVQIENQLVEREDAISLYNYLYGLNYLEPTYKLKLDDKTLTQLSPGERGILLLIFYLLISRDNRPLIIDQPEENLDNETVYKVLVKCIREAKKRRQVIIVTHNPNLAVVCDAEQIIIADIAKKEGNEVTYTCGAIENPIINQEILNILEGTRPAFDNRDAKYLA